MKFTVSLSQDRLLVQGTLDGSQVVRDELRKLGGFPSTARLTVDASDARVEPAGVGPWIEAVQQYLPDAQLSYVTSHLGLVLRYDPRYQHRRSMFSVDDGGAFDLASSAM